MSTDAKGTKILARTFFTQLLSSGYTSNQIIGIATELIDLVTCQLREHQAEEAEDQTPPPGSASLAEDLRRAL